MKIKKRKILRSVFITILAILIIVSLALLGIRRHFTNAGIEMEETPNNDYNRTLKVVADIDYDPYTSRKDGKPYGHDIELIYRLADTMKYNVEVSLLPWNEAVSAVNTGEADMILTLAYEPDEYPALLTSIPLVNDPFVAFGYEDFKSIGQLYHKRLAVLNGTGCISGFVKPYQLEDYTTGYPSNTDAFEALIDGDCDYVIARYSVGRRAIANLADSDGISAVGPTLYTDSMCIGVGGNNKELYDALNRAIINLSSNGELQELSDKWLGHYVETITVGEYVKKNVDTIIYIILGLLLLGFVLFFLFRRSLMMKREKILKKLAECDQLTGLYNRTTYENMIREAVNGSNPETDQHALIVIDMDNFKHVNDTFGHMTGDKTLMRLSDKLRSTFPDDIIGRLGGDEFFIFCPSYPSFDDVLKRINALGTGVNETLSINDTTIQITVSMGIARYPQSGTSFLQLYKAGDEMLYATKKSGKNGFTYLDESGNTVYCQF